MGRFYKTASPQMVDFMYKIPEQAILKAIEGTDKQIDTENLYVTESQKLLQKKALSPDEARQVELIKQHQQGIDEVAQLLSSSPLAALNDRQKVRALQKKIYEDVTRGELAAQYKNYDIRQKHLEEETKRATDKDGNIRIEDVNEAMAAFDRQFEAERRDEQGNLLYGKGTAYDPTTGKYKTYGPEKLVNFYDRKKEFADIAKDWKPSTDTDIKKEFVQGNYYVTTRNKDELLPLNELTWGIYKTMMYDPKAMSYYQQKARIRSGGNKELFNQEMTRLFGERVDPDNPFSAFKMVEVKDAEGKTKMQKVQKYDKDGKPEMKDGKPVTEEVPVMEMANPGELFMAAQAAADKQDINKVIREQSLDLTEQAQMQIDLAKTKAERDDAERREAEKEIAIRGANNNAEVTKVILPYKTHGEARKALDAQAVNLKSSVFNKGEELIKVINNSSKSADEKKKLLAELKTIMQPLQAGAGSRKSLDFSTLKTFATKIAGAGGVATGIDELSQSYKESLLDYTNKNQHYMTLYNASKPKGYDETLTEKDKLYQEYLKLTAVDSKLQDKTAIKDTWNKYQAAEAKLKILTKQFNDDFNNNLDFNNKKGANSNTTTVYSTSGHELKGKVPDSVLKGFNNALTKLSTGQLFPQLLSATNAVVVSQGKAEATSFNKLLEKYNISPEVITALKDGVEEKIPGGKISINLGSARVTPGNQSFVITNSEGKLEDRKIGRGAIQVTLSIYNDKTGKPEINEIYIPKDEVIHSDLKTGSDYIEKYYEPLDIKNNAKTQFGSLSNLNLTEEQKDKEGYAFDGGVYYPHKDRWEFDGREKPMYGEDALDMYRNIKGQIK